jgi:2-keto-3-deoxy-L-rhamnonate aldolase RhmA
MAAMQAGVTPLVRVPAHEAHPIGRLLDAGAMGIIAPHVENADEARAIVAACRFPPGGVRSVSTRWPQFGYRVHDAAAMRQALDASTTVVAMLESPEAVEQAEAIAAVPGVDIVHVGSLDLAEALGVPGRVDDPRVAACHDRVIQACRRHGKTAGIGAVAGQPALARRVVDLGARFITAGVDWDFLLTAAHSRVQSLRELDT